MKGFWHSILTLWWPRRVGWAAREVHKGEDICMLTADSLHCTAKPNTTLWSNYTQINKRNLLLFSHSVMSNSLWSHGLQHARLPCPSLSPRVCSNSCLLSQWCHLTISFSLSCFSSSLQSFPASGSFPMTCFSASGGQSTGASDSASVLPVNIQGWFPLGLTGLISLPCKALSRVICSTTVWKY